MQLDQREQDHALRQQRQLAALEQIGKHRQAIATRIGAESLPNPTELIHQVREERDADLTLDQHRR
ncbi:MAG: hypothetical protein H6644_11530 [Caldilineaceae bacterium]|nr:hypothetical protein [Caldilineaceae bacterium]